MSARYSAESKMTFLLATFLLALVPATLLAAPSVELGSVRVSSLSTNLLRVEPRGPIGFEDEATFSIVGRSTFAGLPITKVNDSFAKTELYTITVHAAATSSRPSFSVHSVTGAMLYDSREAAPTVPTNLLHFPSPLDGSTAYALTDYPRFRVPPWGPSPIPQGTCVHHGARLPSRKVHAYVHACMHAYPVRSGCRPGAQRDARVRFSEQRGRRHLRRPPWQRRRRICRRSLRHLHPHGPLPPAARLCLWHVVSSHTPIHACRFTWWHSYSEGEAKDDIAH